MREEESVDDLEHIHGTCPPKSHLYRIAPTVLYCTVPAYGEQFH